MIAVFKTIVSLVTAAFPLLTASPLSTYLRNAPMERATPLAGTAVISIEWSEADRLQPSGCVECHEVLWCSVLGHVAYITSGAEWSQPHDESRDKR